MICAYEQIFNTDFHRYQMTDVGGQSPGGYARRQMRVLLNYVSPTKRYGSKLKIGKSGF